MDTKLAKTLNSHVGKVLSANTLIGFEKAFMIATALKELQNALTDEYMAPIMLLQGTKLGFVTDRDKKDKEGRFGNGYPMDIVKKCLIEAVLFGLQPYNNQFNIISGSMYPTKEGLGYLLNNFPGLKYKIVCNLPRVGEKSAAVDANIKWTLSGETKEETVPIPIKIDSWTSVDSIIGKATRKARAWLLSTISGMEVPDGEVEDAKVVSTVINKPSKDDERLSLMIGDATTVEELEKLKKKVEGKPEQQSLFNQKHSELSNGNS